MEHKKPLAVAGVIIAILIIAIIGGVFISKYLVQPGVYLNGKFTITYSDGSTQVVSTDESLLSLYKMTVLTNNGKKITSIAVDTSAKFVVNPPDRALKTQYLVTYFIDVEGPYFTGARAYSSLFGFVDVPINSYWDKVSTSRWVWMSNVGGWSFVEKFYRERGSGLQMGAVNIGAENAKAITDALGTGVVQQGLANVLTTSPLVVVDRRNGDMDTLTNWSMTGADFYTTLKRIDWQGAALHTGDFSIGVGKFVRMYDNDQYYIKFKVGYFFRYQDASGEWTPWKAGMYELGSLNTYAANGYWYQMDLTISGSAKTVTV